MNSSTIIKHLQTAKPELQRKYSIKSFALFGSFARGDNKNTSVIDILVEFESPLGMEIVDLVMELEQILAHKVDLVSKKAVKPRMMQQIEPELLYV